MHTLISDRFIPRFSKNYHDCYILFRSLIDRSSKMLEDLKKNDYYYENKAETNSNKPIQSRRMLSLMIMLIFVIRFNCQINKTTLI